MIFHLYVMMQNVDALQQAGAMQLLRPLLLDTVPRCAGLPARIDAVA